MNARVKALRAQAGALESLMCEAFKMASEATDDPDEESREYGKAMQDEAGRMERRYHAIRCKLMALGADFSQVGR